MIKVEKINIKSPVYDITVDKVHNFYANEVLVHNCVEIALPTEPILNSVRTIDDSHGTVDFEGLVQLCTLAAINAGNLDLNDPKDMEKRMELLVRFTNEILDYQDYQAPQARRATMTYRPLGIGIINYAYFLAKNGVKYYDQESYDITHRLAEQMYYYSLKASNKLAQERGSIEGIKDTIYLTGGLLIDSYNKEVDSITNEALHCDWNSLRDIVKQYGVYNSTLLALMPAESSSFVTNATNGIEPIRSLIIKKSNKKVSFVQVVPEVGKLKNQYTYLWDMDASQMNGYIKNAAVFQKFVCQSISANLSYNPDHYEKINAQTGNLEKKIPLEVLINHFLLCTKLGLKTRYYVNTKGEKDHTDDYVTEQASIDEDVEESGGCDGACKL
jgi:ribonucleoside-diphosphate reductase alpha chain